MFKPGKFFHIKNCCWPKVPQYYWRTGRPGGGGGGGELNFFQVGVCGPDFRSVGLQTDICLWKGGGACEQKISKFGAGELEISKFGGLRAKIWAKIKAVDCVEALKFPNFLKRGSCELTLLLEMGPLQTAGEAWKGDLQGRTSPYPLSRSVPPQGWQVCTSTTQKGTISLYCKTNKTNISWKSALQIPNL